MASAGDNPPRITVRPISEVPRADAALVFATRGDPARCWCQWFKLLRPEWEAGTTASRCAALREQTERGDPAPGLIAYLDGVPAGWCGVEPRTRYPFALRSRVVSRGSAEPADDASVWAIVCFVVRAEVRRRGVANALLVAAVDWARQHGARVIEGYPSTRKRGRRTRCPSSTTARSRSSSGRASPLSLVRGQGER